MSEMYSSMTPPVAESGMREVRVAAVVVEDGAEEVGVVLAEGVEAGLDGVARDGGGDGGLGSGVVGGAVGGGGDGSVVGVGVRSWRGCSGRRARPGGRWMGLKVWSQEKAAMTSVSRWVSRRPLESNCWLLEAVGIGVVGDLEEVVAELSDEAELIFGSAVVDEGGEAAVAVGGVVEDFGDGWGEAVVAAVAVEAGVPGEFFGVVAEVELVVGLEEVAGGDDEFGLAVALEAGAGDDVEDAVGAVADVGGVAAALDFDVVDVFGVDLGAEVARRCWCWGSGRRR